MFLDLRNYEAKDEDILDIIPIRPCTGILSTASSGNRAPSRRPSTHPILLELMAVWQECQAFSPLLLEGSSLLSTLTGKNDKRKGLKKKKVITRKDKRD